MELGQGVVWFYIHSFLFFPPGNLPLHPSAMCGNLSVRTPVLGPSAAMYRKRQSVYLGVSRPVGRFSLIAAIKRGVGRQGTVPLAPKMLRDIWL